MALNLPIPPEPKELKKKWKKELEKGGGRMNLARATIKQGTWLTKPLWSEYGWGDELKRYGISWQKFMEIYGTVSYYFLAWAEGEISWEGAIQKLIKEINKVIGR